MKTIQKNAAMRSARRKLDASEDQLRRYMSAEGTVGPIDKKRLRITALGGQNGIGEKNMIVLEYGNDAVILDCGFDLGVNLPGINYAIPVTDYLETIRDKLRGYIISHGHMDHIGGLIHILPKFPAQVFGSRFTVGMVQAQFEKMQSEGLAMPDCQVIDMDKHERVTLGSFIIELVRVTHAIPESSAIVVDTPVGRIINTGDFRLDPEPLDAMPSDTKRLRQLGDEGVRLLMSESTNTTKPGRTPTEHTLQDSFYSLMSKTSGRLIVAVFSSNMNRVQMTINAAHHNGRKVVLDGRSMMNIAELAVRLGNLRIPKGTLISMHDASNFSDDQLVIICTGGQGEQGAALSRMSKGEHRFVTLGKNDTVVVSSTPIPGNEAGYQRIGDDLAKLGVSLFRHPTHEIDGCGPLHVSGHASRDEHAEMIQLTRPRYLMPIYGGVLNRTYHKHIGMEQGIAEQNILMVDNGEVIEFDEKGALKLRGKIVSGSLLVDQTGVVVPEIVTKDRLLLKEDGFVIIGLTISGVTGRLLSSPDVITRGHIEMRNSAIMIEGLRRELKMLLPFKRTSRHDVDLFKQRLKNIVSEYLFVRTGQTPMVIPVLNVVDEKDHRNVATKPTPEIC